MVVSNFLDEWLEKRRRHQDEERRRWCDRHRDNDRVKQWLAENPPDEGWTGTPIEWAYLEMPLWVLR
jgi:hypothetical protein